jgi:hypothetical protein
MTTEQTVAVIEAVKEPTNYGWLLLIAMIGIIPALIKIFWRKK